MLPQKPGLCDCGFCFVIKIKHRAISAIQCLTWAGPFQPFLSIFIFFQTGDVDIKIYFEGPFYWCTFQIKSQVSDKNNPDDSG